MFVETEYSSEVFWQINQTLRTNTPPLQHLIQLNRSLKVTIEIIAYGKAPLCRY